MGGYLSNLKFLFQRSFEPQVSFASCDVISITYKVFAGTVHLQWNSCNEAAVPKMHLPKFESANEDFDGAVFQLLITLESKYHSNCDAVKGLIKE